MDAKQLWDYIQTHQDDDFAKIAEDLSLSETKARDLIFAWAVGDRGMFQGVVTSIEY